MLARVKAFNFAFIRSSTSLCLRSICCLPSLSNQSSLPAVSSPLCFSLSRWIYLIRAAVSASDLTLGKCIHASILTSVENPEHFLINNLISMYWICGSVTFARRVFDRTPQKDLVTWNSILAAYARYSEDNTENIQEGFRLFRHLLQDSAVPSGMALASVLTLSSHSGHICASEAVHGYAVKINLERDEFVVGSLLNIYAKFGRINDARELFQLIPERDVISWNVMLRAYLDMDLVTEALGLFHKFHSSGLRPDEITLRHMLSRIDSDKFNKQLQQIQAHAIKLFSYNYDCDGSGVSCDNSDVISWNKKLSEHLREGKNLAVVNCFLDMVRSNAKADVVTFLLLTSAASRAVDLLLGLQIHCSVLKSGLASDHAVGNSLINMYCKLSCIRYAPKVFYSMPKLDLVSWNSMISGYSQAGLVKEAVDMFIGLLRSGLAPDGFTLASILRICPLISEGLFFNKQVHVLAVKTNNISDKFVITSLIDAYSRNGFMEEAEVLFVNSNGFDVATWNAMMFGYTLSNQGCNTLKLFTLMHRRGERSDEITVATATKACTSLSRQEQGKQIHALVIKSGYESDLWVSSGILDMYAKCGDMAAANLVFSDIDSPDDVVWTTMISGCIENEKEDIIFPIYCRMKHSGVMPDEYTVTNLVKACSCLAALEQGRQIHADAIKLKFTEDPYIGTSLVDMYAKCGNIKDAYSLFKRTETRSIATWNAILVGLAQHGNGEKTLEVFRLMQSQGIKPDRVTFIGVLTACSRSGLVSEAFEHFHLMQREYGIDPEAVHYSCLVHALCGAGHVQEAEKLIESMPFEATPILYEALLAACRVQADIETGKRAAAKLIALKPTDSSTYTLLSNIYAAANKWDEREEARRMMKMKNVKKAPGFSWIDVKEEEHMY